MPAFVTYVIVIPVNPSAMLFAKLAVNNNKLDKANTGTARTKSLAVRPRPTSPTALAEMPSRADPTNRTKVKPSAADSNCANSTPINALLKYVENTAEVTNHAAHEATIFWSI